MALYALLIATSFPIGAAITHALDPIVLTLLRFVLAAVVFGGVLLARRELRRVGLRDIGRYAAVAGTVVVFFVLMFESLREATPVATSALFTLVPLFSAGVARVLLGTRTTRAQLACLVLGAVAAAWVVFEGSLQRALELRLGRGEQIFLLAVVAISAYAPLIKRMHRGESTLVMTFWTLVLGVGMLLVVGLGRLAATDWSVVPLPAIAGVLYLAVFPTAVTFAIAQYAGVRLSPARVMAYTYLTPAYVVLIEGLRGHGWPSPSTMSGVAVAVAATLLLQRFGDARA